MTAFRAVALAGPQFRMDSAAAPVTQVPPANHEALAAAEELAEEIVLDRMADEAEAEGGESIPWDVLRAELGL